LPENPYLVAVEGAELGAEIAQRQQPNASVNKNHFSAEKRTSGLPNLFRLEKIDAQTLVS
jgi:hypothetical protein